MGDCHSACPRCRNSCQRTLGSDDTQAKAVEQWASMDSRRSGLAHRYRDRFRAPLNTRMMEVAIDTTGFAACANGLAPSNGQPQKPQDQTAKCSAEASAASSKMPSPVPNGNTLLVAAVNGFVSGLRTGNPRGAVVGFVQGLIVRPLVNWTGQNVMYSGTFNACMSAGAAGTGFNLSAPGMVW